MAAFADDATRPDLVLLDCHMPGLDGADVARAIRALDPRVPILAYSHRIDMAERLGDVERCLFIAQPFRVAELLMTVSLALSGTDTHTQPNINRA